MPDCRVMTPPSRSPCAENVIWDSETTHVARALDLSLESLPAMPFALDRFDSGDRAKQ